MRRGSASSSSWRPAAARRARPFGAAPTGSSSRPRPMVLRAIPVIRDTAAIPPQPAANASLDANARRCRSSRYGPSVSNRRRIAASLITTLHTAQISPAQLPHLEYSDSIIVLRSLSQDERAYDNPDVFNICRVHQPRLHPIFGGGPHRCICEALPPAELEQSPALLTARRPQLRLDQAPAIKGHSRIRRVDAMRVSWRA